jgi:hypothetical protein
MTACYFYHPSLFTLQLDGKVPPVRKKRKLMVLGRHSAKLIISLLGTLRWSGPGSSDIVSRFTIERLFRCPNKVQIVVRFTANNLFKFTN